MYPSRPFCRRDHEFMIPVLDTAGRKISLSRGFQPEFVSGGNYQRPGRIKSLHPSPNHPSRPFCRRDHEFMIPVLDTAGRKTPLSRGFQPELAVGGNYQRRPGNSRPPPLFHAKTERNLLQEIATMRVQMAAMAANQAVPSAPPTQAYNCVLPPKTTNVIPAAPVISADVIVSTTSPRDERQKLLDNYVISPVFNAEIGIVAHSDVEFRKMIESLDNYDIAPVAIAEVAVAAPVAIARAGAVASVAVAKVANLAPVAIAKVAVVAPFVIVEMAATVPAVIGEAVVTAPSVAPVAVSKATFTAPSVAPVNPAQPACIASSVALITTGEAARATVPTGDGNFSPHAPFFVRACAQAVFADALALTTLIILTSFLIVKFSNYFPDWDPGPPFAFKVRDEGFQLFSQPSSGDVYKQVQPKI
jgi:hypothetical protein